MTLPMHWLDELRSLPISHQLRSSYGRQAMAGFLLYPEVRWTEAAAASIAEDEDHLRGLVKRHCL